MPWHRRTPGTTSGGTYVEGLLGGGSVRVAIDTNPGLLGSQATWTGVRHAAQVYPHRGEQRGLLDPAPALAPAGSEDVARVRDLHDRRRADPALPTAERDGRQADPGHHHRLVRQPVP